MQCIKIEDSFNFLGPVKVTEHEVSSDNVIASFKAEDKDSGAFGQVSEKQENIYILWMLNI